MQAFLEQYGPMLGLISVCVSLLLLGAVAFLFLRLQKLRAQWEQLMKGSNGSNIESLLTDHLKKSDEIVLRLDRADAKLDTLQNKMESSKRFVGLVKYDAFEDVGGSQSFSLAIYDERGDGAIVTSMVGRADCRVYAKEINNGKAGRDLSGEEQAAIEAAVKAKTAQAVKT